MKFIRKLFSHPAKPETKPNNSQQAVLARRSNGKTVGVSKIGANFSDAHYDQDLIDALKTDGKQQVAASRRVAELLDQNEINWSQIVEDFRTLDKQLLVSSYQNDASRFNEMCHSISDESTIFSICQATGSAQIRAALIGKLSNDDRLKQLEKLCKASDKTSYRIIREKREQIKKAANEQKSVLQAQETLFEQLTDHAERHVNHEYAFKLNSYCRKFDELKESATDDWCKQVQGLVDTCHTRLAQSIEKENTPTTGKEEAANETLIAAAATAETSSNGDSEPGIYEELLRELMVSVHAIYDPTILNDGSLLAEYTERFSRIQSAWQDNLDAEESHPLAGDIARQFKVLEESLASFLVGLGSDEKLIFSLGELPDEDSEDTQTRLEKQQLEIAISTLASYLNPLTAEPTRNLAINTAAHKQLAKLKQVHRKTLNQEAESNKIITNMIRRGQAAVKDGHLKQAQGIRYSIERKLKPAQDDRLSDEDISKKLNRHVEKQWRQFLEDLQKLADWQSYAIIPKCENLVEEMKQLADSPLPAEAQATKIKQLQEQWRSMTKGSANTVQDLWEQFKQASDIAYEPCKEHYHALDLEREKNLEDKKFVIQQLNDYLEQYDWENADWAKVIEVLRSTKQGWRNIGSVSRDKNKAIQKDFDTVITAIETRLFSYYESNKNEKERLIKGVEVLTKSTELQHAIDVAIKFQKQWKDIGPCRARDDKKLWTTFRGHCDSIFSKRDAERAEQRAIYDNSVKEAEDLLSKLKSIANADASDIEIQARETDTIKERFESIENLPKSKESALQKRLRKQLDAIEQRLNLIKTEKQTGMWNTLFDINQSLYNLARNSTEDTERYNNIQAHIQSLSNISHTHKEKLLLKLEQVRKKSNASDDMPIRMLCIQAEVISNNNTPESDKNLRMQYQVEQLQHGLGLSSQTHSAKQLAESWLDAPITSAETYDVLHQRFCQSWQKLKSSTANN